MNNIKSAGIEHYLESLLPANHPILQEMETYAKVQDFPVVGSQVGRFLFQISRLQNPSLVFEMGSGFGYSGFWFLLGAPRARIFLTDRHQQNLSLAESWFDRAGFLNRSEFLLGNADFHLRQMGGFYDIIFIDVDKEEYPDTFKLALNHIDTGGLIITDNVLWYGKVIEPDITDTATLAVRQYNQLLFDTPGIFSTILPIRDGLAISLKL